MHWLTRNNIPMMILDYDGSLMNMVEIALVYLYGFYVYVSGNGTASLEKDRGAYAALGLLIYFFILVLRHSNYTA